ncbi:MAG: hypothetical protein JWO80_5283, partial [Bryobacterales bacterium]|nr:hypothetical protein [Bryobacterales bacterium]
ATVVAANVTVTLSVPITNRISAAGVPNASMTVNTGAGPVAAGSALLLSTNTLAFNGVSFTVPTSGGVTIQIGNIRGAMPQAQPGQQITASLSTSLALSNPVLIVATPQRGLLATYATRGITCVGSPLPSTINLTNLFSAGTIFTSTRLTEGFAGAFMPKDATSDTGTRIILSYSGFPSGSQLYVPDLIAGNDAVQPTAGGDIGGQQSGGEYQSIAQGSLLLARVLGTDANGTGGAPVATKGSISGLVSFNAATLVPLTNGSGIAVYEVIDSNPSILESAQFPTFLGLAAPPNQTPVIAHEAVSFAPISTIATATTSDPIPRFAALAPPSDCQALGDCGASYFPALSVDTTSLQYSAPAGGAFQTKYVRVNNTGGGFLLFTAALTFQNGGTKWLTADPPSGLNNATVRLDANPAGLAQGTYGATLTINAGTAGTRTIPVAFTVGPPTVTISSITNAASFQPGPLVAGSLATIKGLNFATSNVSVTFDGVPAQVLYSAAGQINLLVPPSVVAKTQSQIVVTVNGNSSGPQTVQLAPTAPGIFGVLNQDNTLNGTASPERAERVIQIFATGLISQVSGPVTVNIQGQNNLTPIYADAAPGLTGVQQVNIAVPAGLPSGPVSLAVCAVGTNPAQPVCSPAATLTLQ